MGFNCGIVGLPNVGKSTIFNAMTKAGAASSNYPFTTIDPNVGMVVLRDERLDKLAGIVEPERILPTAVEFVDIAGLVKGASRGEGLGNRFLGNIREVDMIAHVVRCFDDPGVVHVAGKLSPVDDIGVVETELMLADLDAVTRRHHRTSKLAKSGDKEAIRMMAIYEELKCALEDGRPARSVLDEETAPLVKDLCLITAKPVIYVANVGEDDLGGSSEAAESVREAAERLGGGFVTMCGSIESELSEMSDEERSEFLEGLGLSESGLDRLTRASYRLLGLITYFTAGKQEVRAWTVRDGAKAPEAAGVIHSDFERGFIKAEVIKYEDFIQWKGETKCREKGLVRIEGKDYFVKDGDVLHFRFAT
ncbi:MAG: redox-regulated ATPase YchF [Thermodesulfobacteriota bacterium]